MLLCEWVSSLRELPSGCLPSNFSYCVRTILLAIATATAMVDFRVLCVLRFPVGSSSDSAYSLEDFTDAGFDTDLADFAAATGWTEPQTNYVRPRILVWAVPLSYVFSAAIHAFLSF